MMRAMMGMMRNNPQLMRQALNAAPGFQGANISDEQLAQVKFFNSHSAIVCCLGCSTNGGPRNARSYVESTGSRSISAGEHCFN